MRNRREWLVIAVCAVIIATGLGYVVWRFTRGGGSVADLRIVAGVPVRRDGTFRIPVTVRNDSDQTVRNAVVEVILFRGDEQVERAEVELDPVEPFTEAKGEVTLKNDPKCCAVVAQPK
ncbi:MAG TPA: hypothetical protein VEK11_20705 [Thermoanaerobaculia bacterium]|nr:hypothetical protein [Thermoanaerobaculia bacterium]